MRLTIGTYLDWVILSAQTGPKAQAPARTWVKMTVEQCQEAGVAVFMKNSLAPYRDGELIQEYPEG